MIDFSRVLLAGFFATIVLTTFLAASRGLRLTRMDIPFLLGTVVTSDRQKAKWIGFTIHVFFGWFFAFFYAAAFEMTGNDSVLFGALVGLVHASFVLTVGMSVVSSIHPRMANDEQGPEPTRMLEPPGFLILNYGSQTPLATYVAHFLYGGVLAYFY